MTTSGPFDYPYMYWVGMDTDPRTTPEALAEFNPFYTETHVPEVMAYGGYKRGTRFELLRGLAHPEPGAPRFVAVYEADAETTQQRETRRAARGTLSSGPPTWEAHDTLWRL